MTQIASALPLLDFKIYGNAEAKTTVFFVAGWPDTHNVFRDNLMKELTNYNTTHRLVGISLPSFDARSRQAHPTFGYSIPNVARMLGKTVRHVQQLVAKSDSPKPILVCHDWGSVVSFELLAQTEDLEAESLFDRVVAIDVGGNVMGGDKLLSVSGIGRLAYIFAYQWFIILSSLLLPRFLSTRLQTLYAERMGQRPRYKDDEGKDVLPHWRMSWPYVWTYLTAFFGGKRRNWQQRADKNRTKGAGPVGRFGVETHLSQESVRPLTVPVLFVHKTSGPAFYSQRWLQEVRKRREVDIQSGSRAQSNILTTPLGHWAFACEGATTLNQQIIDFIVS